MTHYCGHPKRSGGTCRQVVAAEGDVCIWHDPARQKEATEARQRAAAKTNAQRRKTRTADPSEVPEPPKTIHDAIEWASWAVHAVATGKIDARTAHEMAYTLRAFMDGRRHADSVDERVKELAAKLDKLKEGAS